VIFYLTTLYPGGPSQRGTLALVGATLLTGPELEPQPDATVLIRDGVIIDVDLHTHLGSGPGVSPAARPDDAAQPR
jgi:hypothetical protein